MCGGITLKGKDPSVSGQRSPSHQWDRHGHNLFLLTPAWARRTDISPRVLHKHLLLYRQAREARVWVEVKDRAYGSRLQGPRGVSMPSHHRLSQLISR